MVFDFWKEARVLQRGGIRLAWRSKERVSGLRSDRERIVAIKIRSRKIVLRGEVIWEELEAFETLDLDSM